MKLEGKVSVPLARLMVTTQRLSEDVGGNYTPDGRIIAIEILDASAFVSPLGAEPQSEVQSLTAVAA